MAFKFLMDSLTPCNCVSLVFLINCHYIRKHHLCVIGQYNMFFKINWEPNRLYINLCVIGQYNMCFKLVGKPNILYISFAPCNFFFVIFTFTLCLL